MDMRMLGVPMRDTRPIESGVEILLHLRDEIGAGEHEVLVAALERGAAEVVGSQALVLHPGAERAVEHEHALRERVEEARHGRVRVPEGLRWSGPGFERRVPRRTSAPGRASSPATTCIWP